MFSLTVQDDKTYIDFEEFLSFLQSSEPSLKKTITKHNVSRTLNGYKDQPIEVDNKKKYPIISIIRYSFHHMDKIQACRELATKITDSVLGGNNHTNHQDDKTTYDLYLRVAAETLQNPILHKFLSESTWNQPDSKIPTLLMCHRESFTEDE